MTEIPAPSQRATLADMRPTQNLKGALLRETIDDALHERELVIFGWNTLNGGGWVEVPADLLIDWRGPSEGKNRGPCAYRDGEPHMLLHRLFIDVADRNRLGLTKAWPEQSAIPAAPHSKAQECAEWIFEQRPDEERCDVLFQRARRAGALGEFTYKDFVAAYGMVYETKPHRPPATGWPLRSPYKERPKKSAKSR
jgi:hypothetical protein